MPAVENVDKRFHGLAYWAKVMLKIYCCQYRLVVVVAAAGAVIFQNLYPPRRLLDIGKTPL